MWKPPAEAVHLPSHVRLQSPCARVGRCGPGTLFRRPSPGLRCREILLVQSPIHGITKTNQTATFLPALVGTFKHRNPAFRMSTVKQSIFSALRRRPFTTQPRFQFDLIQRRTITNNKPFGFEKGREQHTSSSGSSRLLLFVGATSK